MIKKKFLIVAYVAVFVVYNIAFAFEVFGVWSTLGVIFGVLLIGRSVLTVVLKTKRESICYNCHDCVHFDKCKMSEKIDKKNHL